MKKIFFFYFLILSSFSFCNQKELKKNKPTICLNMIVRNESKVISRCLESVKHIIDYYVIVDTGSTDSTKNVIQESLKNIPGVIHDKSWVDFGHNRNEALKLAKGKADYILIMDADETLEFTPEFKMPKLDKDSYLFSYKEGDRRAFKQILLKSFLNWQWAGVTDEEIYCPNAITQGILSGVHNKHFLDGSFAKDPNRCKKNIAMLEKALEKMPNHSRMLFKLGVNYKADQNFDKALECFTKRSNLNGWDQETFSALYEIGKIHEIKGGTPEAIISSYSRAYHFRPKRAEPLYELSRYFIGNGNPALAYIIAKHAKSIPNPSPEDNFMVNDWIYNFGIPFLCIDTASATGRYADALDYCHEILARKNLPEGIINVVEKERGIISNNLYSNNRAPDVWLVTMKKAGTHMMTKFLRLLLSRNEQEYEYVKTSSADYRAGLVVGYSPSYKVKFAHLPYEKNDPSYKKLYQEKKILLIRDPRDVLISGAHFIPKIFQLSEKNHPPYWAIDYVTTTGPFLERFANLPLPERLTCMITRKVPEKLMEFTPEYYQADPLKFIPPFDFSLQIPAAADYINSPNTLIVRYEDLIGPKGGGTIEAQQRCFERIANFIGASYDSELGDKISDDLYGASFTFRKGSSKSWKTHFSEENKKLFIRHFGKDLKKMGYEESKKL